jgi:hypothetical protein
MAASTGM